MQERMKTGENLCSSTTGILRLFVATVVFVGLVDVADIGFVAVVRIVKIVDIEVSHIQRFIGLSNFCLHAVVLQCHRNCDAVFIRLVTSALNLFPTNTTRNTQKQITRLLQFRYTFICVANANTKLRSSNFVRTITATIIVRWVSNLFV